MKKDIILFVGIFSVLLLLAGGTYAYWTWQSNTDKDVVFNTVNGVEDYIVYDAGDSHFVGDFQPSNVFCNSISTTLSFYKTENVKDIKFVATIYMDINTIESNISSSDSVYWVVTRGGNDITCLEGLDSPAVISYGTFNGKTSGSTFALTSGVELELTTTEQFFTVWIWIDNNGSNLDSLTGQTLDTNVWTQIDMLDNKTSDRESAVGEAYAVYSADDNSLRFYRSETPIEVGSTYNSLTATAVYTGFEDDAYTGFSVVPWKEINSNIKSVVFEDEIFPLSTAYWFHGLRNCTSFDVTKLNTSNVTDMGSMFENAAVVASTITITGLNTWDTSNVTGMYNMFSGMTGTTLNIGDLSGWNTSNVTDMSGMFFNTANGSTTTLNITGLENWDTSNVTTMEWMFYWTAKSVTNFSLDLSDWNVSKVTNYDDFNTDVEDKVIPPLFGEAYAVYSADDNSLRFYRETTPIAVGSTYDGRTATAVYTGFEDDSYSDQEERPWQSYRDSIRTVEFVDEVRPLDPRLWFINLIYCSYMDVTNLDVSKVTDMNSMFGNVGIDASSLQIVGLDTWDTSNVTNMRMMFLSWDMDSNGPSTWDIGDISGWDVSNVTDMYNMFFYAGRDATSFSLNLSGWDVSNVTNMSAMFVHAGYDATTWNITGLNTWNPSSLTGTGMMFYNAASSATNAISLDFSGWDTSNVTSMRQMFYGFGPKLSSVSLKFSGWDTSNVTDMESMFDCCEAVPSVYIYGLEDWDTSSVTTMTYMFRGFGQSATNGFSLDLSGWNVCNVTAYNNFNKDVTDKIMAPNWGMSCPT